MELSKRLQAVADLLSGNKRVADIGCDHGFVSIYLIESRKASWCLAMDVNKGPLEHAKDHILDKRLSTYIETRLSDGAKAIQYITDENGHKKLEVEAALIAGMGGRLMVKILQDSLDKFQQMDEFILQPQSEIAKVRRFIREMGYHIEKEDMVLEDGKFYPMMKAVKGKVRRDISKNAQKSVSINIEKDVQGSGMTGEIQKLYDEYGEYLLKNRHPVLLKFLQKEEKIYQDILENLEKQDTVKSKLRQKQVREKLNMINQGLEWYKSDM